MMRTNRLNQAQANAWFSRGFSQKLPRNSFMGVRSQLILRGDPPVLKDDDEQQNDSANAAPAPALTAVLIMRRRVIPEFSSILPVRSL
jgi:hypothetical protein